MVVELELAVGGLVVYYRDPDAIAAGLPTGIISKMVGTDYHDAFEEIVRIVDIYSDRYPSKSPSQLIVLTAAHIVVYGAPGGEGVRDFVDTHALSLLAEDAEERLYAQGIDYEDVDDEGSRDAYIRAWERKFKRITSDWAERHPPDLPKVTMPERFDFRRGSYLGRGWHGDPHGHREAAAVGWMKRRGYG